jgi:excisionase family DNA binding protein
MNEIVVISPDQLSEIIIKCLEKVLPKSKPIAVQEPPTHLYSIRELADFLGCSTVTAQKLKNSGRIRFKQYGRKCVFNTAEILEDIANHKKIRL